MVLISEAACAHADLSVEALSWLTDCESMRLDDEKSVGSRYMPWDKAERNPCGGSCS